MSSRIGGEHRSVPYGPFDLPYRHLPLLDQPVGNDSNFPVEEIEHAVLNTTVTGPKFVNAVPQKISLGTPELMTHFSQPLHPDNAFILHLGWQAV